MKIKRIGVDLAKNVYQLHGVDDRGNAVWKRRLSRGKWLAVLCNTAPPGTVVGMESCAGVHHWARELTDRGYEVKIIPPQFVKPFVKSNKNDANDAQAICQSNIPKTRETLTCQTYLPISQKSHPKCWM